MFRRNPYQQNKARLIDVDGDDEYEHYEMVDLQACQVDKLLVNRAPALASKTVKTPCRIVDNLVPRPTDDRKKSPCYDSAAYSLSSAVRMALFVLTCLSNASVIYFVYQYNASDSCCDTHEPIGLLYIAVTGVVYLAMCGIFQIFIYPEQKLTMAEFAACLKQIVASTPNIQVVMNGCNLVRRRMETGNFERVFVHRIAEFYPYQRIIDKSDNIDAFMRRQKNCCCSVLHFQIHFHASVGDENTRSHYQLFRDEFIATHCTTNVQSYSTSVIYIGGDGNVIDNALLNSISLPIDSVKRVWIIPESRFVRLFFQDATYWFCVLCGCQWLFAMIAFASVSKTFHFGIRKQIFQK